jgi:hypothetical protein
MVKKTAEIVIPRDEAVFWLDKNGFWHNANGKFQHPKIINYFHSCIRRDQNGYHLYQRNEQFREKVYFTYEDQALFVFDVLRKNEVILVLNTKRRIKLKPRCLFIKNDSLYMRMGKETIKFAEQGLVKIAQDLEDDEDGQLYIRSKNRRYKIPILEDPLA